MYYFCVYIDNTSNLFASMHTTASTHPLPPNISKQTPPERGIPPPQRHLLPCPLLALCHGGGAAALPIPAPIL